MKQVNFSHSGGFPLEQETLERLQTAYRSELFGALQSHLSINTGYNYIVAPATNAAKGWAIIQQDENNLKDSGRALPQTEGILYPIAKGTDTGYLKTTRTGVNLVYGTGVSQTAYFDYEAEYITETEYGNGISQNSDALRIEYYDLANFKIVKDIQSIQADIDTINQTYLPLDGSKAMKGDLDLDIYQLSKLDIKETPTANVRVTDFRLGSTLGRALVNNNTKLTLNYNSDWQNTSIGGKVYLENLNTSNSIGSFLAIDSSNQVTKNNMVIDLMDRITALESKITAAVAVPIGMIAIWGKTDPIPSGWEEYVPLKGKMPVGLFNPTPQERGDLLDGDGGNGITYYRDANGSVVFPFDTMGKTAGRIGRILKKENIPPLDITLPVSADDNSGGNYYYVNASDEQYGGLKTYTGAVNNSNVAAPIDFTNPYRVVQFIQYTGGSSDTIPPTAPNLIISNIGTTSITLRWTASSDNVAVTNYILYRSGALPIPLGNVLYYDAKGLSTGTTYSFYITAEDAAGNISTSNTVKETTKSIVEPTTPDNFTAALTGVNRIDLSWIINTNNNIGVVYEIYRKETYPNTLFEPIHQTSETYYIDRTINSDLNYTYYVVVLDADGKPTSHSTNAIEVKGDPNIKDE
ncbi:fibronectin type III domain-containing protein [[Flexibacter] sp. ATCC 35103]|uniref:fibronectin type III domain-containing protein n=1 Tax=[Flexibacter] sp. ATCC 35103 TaxID=1937528 RepID=UPI0009CFC936|nr:fibronectin type III domain-containing protein [[Flexibacter] sp. ATCC 35103]OMQ11849.1 hypothetical protein BXU01_10035 [[Flexibacter] sp. ATCC 35103]